MSASSESALSEVLTDATPGFACGEDVKDGVFQFRMNNITSEGQLDLSKRRRVPRDYRNIGRFLVQQGDVLFNATNSPDLVGKTAFFPGLEEPAVFSNHFLRLRPRDGDIDGRYLTRWLNLQFKYGRFKGMCRQWVNQATVSRDALLSLRIPLPSLSAQRRIVAILDKADELRVKRRAALAKLDTLTQSIFFDMFGDPAANPKGWPRITLKQALTIPLRNGLSPSKTGKVSAQVLTLSAITGSAFDDAARKVSTFLSSPPVDQSVASKDFLICRGNGNIQLVGRGRFPTRSMPEVTFPDTMIAARVSDQLIEPAFLQHVWNSIAVRLQIEALARTTNGMFKVNQTMLEGITFISPPVPLQRQFAYRATVIEETKKKERESLAGLDALFSVLQHRAFRGEL